MSAVINIVKPEKAVAIRNSRVQEYHFDLFPIVLKINTKSWTDREFYDFCQAHEDLRFETDARGDLLIMPPTTTETSRKNNRLSFYLTEWAIKDGTGEVFESNGMFVLPNGAKKSPDAFWILKERYWSLPKKDREEKFAPIVPDFVLELRSKSDRLKPLQAKMQEYIQNGVRLGWLIDPHQKKIYIYRLNGEVEILENAKMISGENVLPGFELDLSEIFLKFKARDKFKFGKSRLMSESEMYEQRGFASRVGFGQRPALLIIDFINAFTDPACLLGSNLDSEIAATKQLLDLFRKQNLPIHFTTTAYEEGFASGGVFIKKVPSLKLLKRNSPLVEIDERLKPITGEIVWEKKYASAFFGTSLAAALIAQKIDTLIITGCTTSGCVRASAVDGCQNEFHTIVVRECVGDRSVSAHEANLNDLDAKYADVVSVADALNYLQNL